MKLIIHNVRSCHNVGSLFRSADAFGIEEIILTGFTPYPKLKSDTRLPYVAERAHRQIAKTALGAEETMKFRIGPLKTILQGLRDADWDVYALEQSKVSTELKAFSPSKPLAIAVGAERHGFTSEELTLFDGAIEIPMKGSKESLNVSVAGAVAMYELSNRSTTEH